MRKPNIIFIFADDWGWGDMSLHGHPTIRTPNLDQMAAEGMEFYDFTVSNPVCSPSRTAIMTGHYPARHGVHQHFAHSEHNAQCGMPDWLDPKVTLLPRLLQNAGYVNGHFGKWHLTNRTIINAPEPTEYAYDEHGVFNAAPGSVGVWDGMEELEPADAHQYPHAYLTRGAIEKTIRFMERNRDRPFFINLWVKETHTPIQATPEDKSVYPNVSEPELTYYAAVSSGDKQIGRVLRKVKELGLDEDTLVIFSSDNGPEFPSEDPTAITYFSRGITAGFKGQKRSLYDGGVRVPFLVRWPGKVPAGGINSTTVVTGVDILPTLCEVAGAELPADYRPDGESVLPAFMGEPFQRSKPIYWDWRGYVGPHPSLGDYWWPRHAIRDGQWKLYTNEDGSKVALFDMEEDWKQDRDVSGAQPQLAQELLSRVLQWRKDLDATMIWDGSR